MTDGDTLDDDPDPAPDMAAILDSASESAKRVLQDVLNLELGHLAERKPNATKLARGIADIIRRAVP
jgi:hypothetical protein